MWKCSINLKKRETLDEVVTNSSLGPSSVKKGPQLKQNGKRDLFPLSKAEPKTLRFETMFQIWHFYSYFLTITNQIATKVSDICSSLQVEKEKENIPFKFWSQIAYHKII